MRMLGNMKKPDNSMTIAKVHGVPIYLHWSFPAGAFMPIVFAKFEIIPSLYLVAGYVFLVATHEIGHLLAARMVAHRVVCIQISGAGGQCWTETPRTRRAAVVICSGGLIAQLVIFAAGVTCFVLLDEVRSYALSYWLITATFMNAAMFLTNIMPSRSALEGTTDGYVLWSIIKVAWRQRV
jgi:hypothetical protein